MAKSQHSNSGRVAHGITALGDKDDGRAPILDTQQTETFEEALKRGLCNPRCRSLSDQPDRRGPPDCAKVGRWK
jgi:hypothetical protein